ncbi:glycosyltransferase [Lyngbya confervoides]|uniref:Glycosyltransferase n=1 Tax=Lyngbya confervoides BDU141951 TaxID=1574623 RepID=A0ABD4T6E6_9CYAN|nr:glycosyltransferase [Lyngbya confervoides]MCM1984034.1 glycosyltransferase [Lyngbya confervoides BDU141951]
MRVQDRDIIATVLMAIHNDEKFVEQAVNSILCQLGENMEFLIIDDHSSDSSPCILAILANGDDRIRIIRNSENRGVGYCAWLGMCEARGEYVIRMDSDDICFPDRIEKQIDFLEQNPEIDIVGAAAIEIDDQGNQGKLRQMPLSHDNIARVMWACPIIQPAVAFRRERVLLAGNYNPQLRRRIDYDLWFRCLKAGLRFANLPEPLVYYRFTPRSHQKQTLKRAIEQAQIGWRGCWMLKSPWWQYLAVMVPILRAILPPQLSHAVYRMLAFADPRNKVQTSP